MKIYMRTNGGKLEDCIFNVSIHIESDEEINEIIDSIKKYKELNIIVSNVKMV